MEVEDIKVSKGGCEYFGIGTGACFTKFGNNVIFIDIDNKKSRDD